MSWSAQLEIVRDPDTGAQALIKVECLQFGHGEAESRVAIDRAIDAAKSIIDLLPLGHGRFNVSLSGHSNPGNQPSPGWANDYMTIRIEKLGAYVDPKDHGDEGD